MHDANGKVARLTVDDNEIELPMYEGSEGPMVIDVGKLTSLGYFTYDPGFVSTASCDSEITYIDGNAGVLLHRGYPIEQLAEQSDYLELAYVLLNGELPDAAQKKGFVETIKRYTMVHDQLRFLFRGFRRDAHPMAIMCGVVGALSAFYHDSLNIDDAEHRRVTAHRLIAKMPTLAAMSYKYSWGEPFIYPRNDLRHAENFLHMMFATPCEDYQVSPVLARAMDRIFLLHADHEQNASTSTVRLAGSTGANPFACIAAGIAALWGPAHGGANEAVLNMLDEIGDEKNIDRYVKAGQGPARPVPPDGLRPQGLQELRPPGQSHAADLPRGARGTRRGRLSGAAHGPAPGEDRARGRVLRREAAVSERRLLFRHHPESHRHTRGDVHGNLRHRPHPRLDRPLERDDQRPLPDRPARGSCITGPRDGITCRWGSGHRPDRRF